jgi:hypothetical protein
MYQSSAYILIINIFSQIKLISTLKEQIGAAPATTSRLKLYQFYRDCQH